MQSKLCTPTDNGTPPQPQPYEVAFLELSVVVPVHNEAENLQPLLTEIAQALGGLGDHEILYVDDDTAERLGHLRHSFPRLQILRHRQYYGQSTALLTGIRAAKGEFSPPWTATDRTAPPTYPVCSEFAWKEIPRRNLPHARELQLFGSDGQKWSIRLDQGLGYWEPISRLRVAFPFDKEPEQQTNHMKKLNFVIQTISGSHPTYWYCTASANTSCLLERAD